MQRRTFLSKTIKTAGALSLLGLLPDALATELDAQNWRVRDLSPQKVAGDEAFWAQVRQAYDQSPRFINLESGYYNPAPLPVLNAQLDHIRQINQMPAYYMRTDQYPDRANIKRQLANFVGCTPDTLAMTRNTTEALNIIIAGYPWEKGDEIIYSSHEYPSMKEAIKQQEKRYGIVGKTFEMPLQVKSDEEILDLYKKQYTPKSKVVLVSLVVYMTGRVMPVKKIADWAHSKGLEVIVDAAHAVSHVNFRVDSIGADYLGTSLHKWVAAPLGLGFLYVKKEHVKKIWPLLGDVEKDEDDIEKLEHLGTIPMGTHLALLNAIRFQEFLQPARKEARLKLLRNHWLREVKDLPGVVVNTPIEEENGCAIGNIHIEKYKNNELQEKLLKDYGIFTVAIGEPAYGVRITPNVFNTLAEIDLLVKAIRELVKA